MVFLALMLLFMAFVLGIMFLMAWAAYSSRKDSDRDDDDR
jgi:hypothetical protein